jgi:CheY-like chemotaxis protein
MNSDENIQDISLIGYKILLVEDNKLNQILATAMLKHWGAEVIVAGNGQIAIEAMEKESFDLVLMDIQMPVMDGLTASKIIRENLKSTIPILALSANVLQGVAEKCEESGMQGYISKPYEAENLVRKIIDLVSENKKLAGNTTNKFDNLVVADTQNLKRIIGSNQAEFKNMIARFLELTPAYALELNMASEANDLEALALASHKIKSSIDLVSAQIMRDVVSKIYQISKPGGDLNEIKLLINDFNSYYKLLEVQLQAEIDSAQPE